MSFFSLVLIREKSDPTTLTMIGVPETHPREIRLGYRW